MTFKNGSFAFAKLLLAFALGAGTAVAAAYNTFETATAHRVDQDRTEKMLQEIRNDVKLLLERTPPHEKRLMPRATPPVDDNGKLPPLKQAENT